MHVFAQTVDPPVWGAPSPDKRDYRQLGIECLFLNGDLGATQLPMEGCIRFESSRQVKATFNESVYAAFEGLRTGLTFARRSCQRFFIASEIRFLPAALIPLRPFLEILAVEGFPDNLLT